MIGETVSHYKILEKIGEGGMGVVYKAQDTKLDRFVALKFLASELTRDATAKQRFIQEAKAASKLDHPNICTIYKINETEDGQLYIAMAYYEGETLKEKTDEGPLRIDETLTIAIYVAEGLKEAHEHGITHRDIKPSNIMITDKGQTKILDFGLAKSATGSIVTKAGMTLGTIAIMSPEQARGEKVDNRTDIWSLGVVIYNMLTGQMPFKGEYEHAIVYSIMNVDPEPITGLRTGVPMELERIISKCLEKEKTDRYPTAEGLMVDLRHLKKDKIKILKEPVPETQIAAPEPPIQAEKTGTTTIVITHVKRKVIIGLAALVGVIALVVAALMFMPKDEAVNSLAILPFTITGGQEEIEFLSEGIPDHIVASLQKLPDLSVYPFSSVLQRYGKEPQDPILVGSELNVKAIVTGKIVPRGSNVTINIEIVDTREGRVLHSQIFEEKLSDLANIPTKIAENITELLKVKITGEEAQQAFKIETTDPGASQNYMIGRSFMWKRTPKDFERAIEYFNKAIYIDPGYAEAYSGIADAYILHLDYTGIPEYIRLPRAREAVKKALELNEDLAEAHTSMNLIYRSEGKLKKALKEVERAIEINPNYFIAYQWLGFTFAQMGNYEKAIENDLKALSLDPVNPMVNSNLALRYRSIGQTEKVKEQSLKNIEINSESAMAYYGYGNTLSLLSEHDSAIEQAKKALALNSLAYRTISYAVLVYQRAGQFDKAIAQGKRRIELYPQSPAAFSSLASVYRDAGGNDKVIEEFEKIIKQYPHSPAAFNELGIAYRNAGEYDKAILQHKKAIELAPLYPEAYNQLGLTYKAAGEYDKAVEQFKKAISCTPTIATLTYLSNLGNLYIEQGEIDKATELYENAIERDPDWARLYNDLGILYRNIYEWDKAIDIFEEAVELSPDNIVIKREYGITLTFIGEYDKAIERYKKAQKLDFFTFDDNNAMGTTYFCARDYNKAIEYYKKAVKIDPSNETPIGNLSYAYLVNEQYKDAADAYQKWFGLRKIPNADEIFEECFAAGEYNKPSLQKYLRNILEESDKTNNPYTPHYKARFYAYMDETDSAIVMLEKAFDEKDTNLPRSMSDPVFDNLRSDPRFQALLTKMKLDKYFK